MMPPKRRKPNLALILILLHQELKLNWAMTYDCIQIGI